LVKWCLKKAEEYLQSAQENIRAGRLFPAAEEIFRSVEMVIEFLEKMPREKMRGVYQPKKDLSPNLQPLDSQKGSTKTCGS